MTLGIALGRLVLSERMWERERREAHFNQCTRKCFVKVSGDMFLEEVFLHWVTVLALEAHVVISIGGGTQINATLQAHDVTSEKHPRLGRDTTDKGYQLAQQVLEDNRSQLLAALKQRAVYAEVVLPIVAMGSQACHVDGDIMVLNAYWGFHELYVITTSDRVEAKKMLFTDLPKVTTISL